MKQLKPTILLSLIFILSFSVQAIVKKDSFTLEQIVVFSRHGLRAPIDELAIKFNKITPNQWPKLNEHHSYLTIRGGVLETYLGNYLKGWLVDHQLLVADICPTEKDVYIYTNRMQRTIATGQFFAVGAFPGCFVPIIHKEALNTKDPLFSPVITDDSDKYKIAAITSMNKMASSDGIVGLNKRLNSNYQLIADIINYKQSKNCLIDKQCDFTASPTQLIIKKGKKPGAKEPIHTSASIANAFLLQYYEGAPLNHIAWGKIKNEKQLAQLIDIKKNYSNLLFGSPLIAKQISANLIRYINETFSRSDNKAKFTFLVGHDSNIASLLSAIEIKPYTLPNQFETTPIGGKVVFQKWRDNKTNEQLIKIEYFYQSTSQIRNLKQLNRNNPPQKVVLEMKDCPINAIGFCSFDKFKKVLSNISN